MGIDELTRLVTQLQQQIGNLIKPEVGRWVDWTPTVDQGGNVARTVSLARYKVKDNEVQVISTLSITGAGTGGQAIHIAGIPAAIAPDAGTILGIGMLLDNGTAFYVGAVYAAGADDLVIYAHNAGTAIGSTPNFALANGDVIYLNLKWEA